MENVHKSFVHTHVIIIVVVCFVPVELFSRKGDS